MSLHVLLKVKKLSLPHQTFSMDILGNIFLRSGSLYYIVLMPWIDGAVSLGVKDKYDRRNYCQLSSEIYSAYGRRCSRVYVVPLPYPVPL